MVLWPPLRRFRLPAAKLQCRSRNPGNFFQFAIKPPSHHGEGANGAGWFVCKRSYGPFVGSFSVHKWPERFYGPFVECCFFAAVLLPLLAELLLVDSRCWNVAISDRGASASDWRSGSGTSSVILARLWRQSWPVTGRRGTGQRAVRGIATGNGQPWPLCLDSHARQ